VLADLNRSSSLSQYLLIKSLYQPRSCRLSTVDTQPPELASPTLPPSNHALRIGPGRAGPPSEPTGIYSCPQFQNSVSFSSFFHNSHLVHGSERFPNHNFKLLVSQTSCNCEFSSSTRYVNLFASSFYLILKIAGAALDRVPCLLASNPFENNPQSALKTTRGDPVFHHADS
jgi:hypothetical protein